MTFPNPRVTTIALLTVLTAAAAGCAQQPVRPAAGAPVAASSAAATASTPAKALPPGITPHIMEMARDNGYRPEVRNGKTFFCRHEIPIGSTLPVTHCVDATNLRWEVEYEQQERRALEESSPMNGEPAGGGGR